MRPAGAVLAVLVPALAAGDGETPARWMPVETSRIRVESGRIAPRPTSHNLFDVSHPSVRALVPGNPGTAARLTFVYEGPTVDSMPLASGELRRQVGLKLRARDTCNIVYVTWHISPGVGIHVQVKYNPTQRRHSECRDHGYVSFPATLQRPAVPIAIGERHTLEAHVAGRELRVTADGALVWTGILPSEAFSIEGPAGFRSDNVQLSAVEMWVGA